MISSSFNAFFHFDRLAIILIGLAGFIGITVSLFASQYLKGDRHYSRFLGLLALLIVSISVMAAADNLLVLLAAWLVSNTLLLTLMVHKRNWQAAANAGLLTAKIFSIGFIALSLAFFLLYWQTGETSIQKIVRPVAHENLIMNMALVLIVIAAISQSAIWPFHRWLISSLNSPTPASAMMHAGLVNGGGFVLARFAPLLLVNHTLLNLLYLLGITTALLGTLWKLMQSDVKRMLACSTMGQMGYMFAQCGLGFFPAAIAHLCWHGLFKANLFLASNSTAQEIRFNVSKQITITKFVMALLTGLIASYFFATALHYTWQIADTALLFIGLAFIAASQFALAFIMRSSWLAWPLIVTVTTVFMYAYGTSIRFMEWFFQPMHIFQPQPLNLLHIVSFAGFIIVWSMMVWSHKVATALESSKGFQRMYMKALNASQPHPSTITCHHNDYQYE